MTKQERILVQLSQMRVFFMNTIITIDNIEQIGIESRNHILTANSEKSKRGIEGILDWIEDTSNEIKAQIGCVTIKPVNINKYH